MRVFMTGASGWIGSPSVRSLVAAGHEVVGLARSDDAAAAVEAAGGVALRGDLSDLTLLRARAADSDGVVHMAFRHDIAFTGDFAGAAASDLAAIEAFGDALAGSGNPLVIASGTLGLKPGSVATENDQPDRGGHPRTASAYAALELANRDVRSVVIRFAPTVHGEGDHGFIATLVGIARESGVSGYLGDGSNRWPAVHRSDAAELVHRAVESAPAGSVLHATAEDGVTTKAIAEAIGSQLGVPVESIPEDRADHFSFLAGFFGMDAPASSDISRELLGWNPTGPTLLEDIDAGRYTS
ncbi:MAG TPA: SDR family oxidoreductase [Mycobacteriales bacterium]|jgi:nucleoside-diphosphate-sugar epimerase|nr:SDR family oxidoreductase [Mycobacteriales bacterium]